MTTRYRKINGFCPLGCGRTLCIPAGDDRITCSNVDCPQRRAVNDLLQEEETEHLVHLEHGFTIRHPLRERIGFELESCPLHDWMMTHRPSEADHPGLYRVTDYQGGWIFVALQTETRTD